MTVLVNKTTTEGVNGNGATILFSYDFNVQSVDDIKVIIKLGSAPAFDGTNNAAIFINTDTVAYPGGVVFYPTVGDKLTANDTITIKRGGAFIQPYRYINNEVISAETIEAQLDLAAMERQEIQDDYINFGSEVAPPLPPPSAEISIQDVIQISRPIYSMYGDSLLIAGGAFYTYGTVPRVITVDDYATINLGALTPFTTRYVYIRDYKVEQTGNTVMSGATDLLTVNNDIPVYSEMRGGFYNGKDKCIMAVAIDGSGDVEPFKHDGGDLILFEEYIQFVSQTIPANVQSYMSLGGVPEITRIALIHIEAYAGTIQGTLAYSGGFGDSLSNCNILFSYPGLISDTEFISGLTYSLANQMAFLGVQFFASSAGSVRVGMGVSGWYLPRGL